jgi:uridine kinase
MIDHRKNRPTGNALPQHRGGDRGSGRGRGLPVTPSDFPALLERIADAVAGREPPTGMRTRVVAVDGAGGAGKSSFARHLADALGGCAIVHTDDFASWDNPVDWWPQLIELVLEPISHEEAAHFTPTQWAPDMRPEAVEITPAAFLVLEGVTASREAFRPYLTYAIWIETSTEVRLRRGLDRDGETARPQWEAWMAAEDAYCEREHPDLAADLVVNGGSGLWS